MADEFDSEGNIISLKAAPAPVVSQPIAILAKTTVPAQSPHPTPPLASLVRKPSVNTTEVSDDRPVWKQRALPGTKPCETYGFITPKLNVFIQNILAEERKEMKQMFAEKHLQLENKLRDNLKCRCGGKPVVPADHVPIVPLATGPATASTISESKDESQQNSSAIAPLAGGWINLLAKLRSQNIDQLLKLQKATKKKDKHLALKDKEIKNLKTRIACLVHEDNMDHLDRQQSCTSYSSSEDSESISSKSYVSSYKESSCESSNRQTNPVTGHKQTRFVSSHRTRRCSQSSSASNYEQHKSVTSHHRTRREADDVETRRRQQTDYISRIGGSVDTLAKLYSPARYTHVSTKVNYPVEGGPSLLDVFPALCLFLGEEEPTAEELAKYDSYLASQLRPAPVFSPDMPRIRVNWTALNPFQQKNLPKPTMFPVSSCSLDPQIYERTERHAGNYRNVLSWEQPHNKYPFGHRYGFVTNMGIVAVPSQPMRGYHCNELSGEWYIDARGWGCK